MSKNSSPPSNLYRSPKRQPQTVHLEARGTARAADILESYGANSDCLVPSINDQDSSATAPGWPTSSAADRVWPCFLESWSSPLSLLVGLESSRKLWRPNKTPRRKIANSATPIVGGIAKEQTQST